ncbi:hypothetical protein [Bacillus testis]|uniref:hypothetical protein n=1 Tax=Bacillus testis TaxID=1622072 RepID=UPI00067EA9C3|nr:hypothetical protein [Bacillus testis]
MKNFLFAAILLAIIILAGCSTNEETETKVLTDEHTPNEDLGKRSVPLQLSQEQKEKYFLK